MGELRIKLTGERAVELGLMLSSHGECKSSEAQPDKSVIVDFGSTDPEPGENTGDVEQTGAMAQALVDMVKLYGNRMGVTVEVLQ